MYRRYRKITRCINHVNDTSHSNKEICKQCLNDYVNLNTIYDTEGSYNEFCMDIVDMVVVIEYNFLRKCIIFMF